MNIHLSQLNPLNFTEVKDNHSGELQREYVQQFFPQDYIRLQVIGSADLEVMCQVANITFSFRDIRQFNTDLWSYNVTISADLLPKYELIGLTLRILDTNTNEYVILNSQSYIEVVDECESLKLIEYTNKGNISAFSTFFDEGNIKFQLRLPLGYKSTSYADRLVSETFRNQNQEIRHLYAYPYQTKTLIIGDGLGIPYWMAKLINYIFCLSDVSIGNEKVVRSDDSVPERQGGMDGYPLHIYNMVVERQDSQLSYNIELGDFNNDFSNDFLI